MASGTRSATTIAELDKKYDEKHAELSAQMAQMFAGMEEMRVMMRERATIPEDSTKSGNGPRFGVQQNNTGNHYATRISKVDFPKFDSRNVHEWLYRCENFFRLDETTPDSKVMLASIHLEGLALQ